jgi:hypothetical protein
MRSNFASKIVRRTESASAQSFDSLDLAKNANFQGQKDKTGGRQDCLPIIKKFQHDPERVEAHETDSTLPA